MEKILMMGFGMYTVGVAIAVGYTAYHVGYYQAKNFEKK